MKRWRKQRRRRKSWRKERRRWRGGEGEGEGRRVNKSHVLLIFCLKFVTFRFFMEFCRCHDFRVDIVG